MREIRAGNQYYVIVKGQRTVATVKGPSQKGPGFWRCELAFSGGHLTMFSVVDIPTDDFVLDETPPEIPSDC